MTDQTSTQSQPSMEDILASIRRIIDDEDVKAPAPASSIPPALPPQQNAASFAVDEEEAARARAEYDAAMAVDSLSVQQTDPAVETIFPQREGALWRRVAGHPLSEGETDPLPADDTLELTEAVDDDFGELELSELLDSTDDDDAGGDAHLLDTVAGSVSTSELPSIGIGAMTAAGVGAAAMTTSGAMDRITQRMSHAKADESSDDEDVLDLTRSIDSDGSIEELASAMSGNPRFEEEDLPEPIFERVDVASHDDAQREDEDDEVSLDRSFETVAVTDLDEDYAGSLAGKDEDDDHERALDERFYEANDFDDQPPEITGDYAASLGGDAKRARSEGAPTEDEMETVGGLVRDALRGRLPATPQREPDATPLVSDGAGDSAARSLASLARYDAQAPRRIYGGIKITEDDDSPTIEGMVQDTLRPMLRDWLNDNLPTLVENMVKQEVDRISARSRRFVRDDD